MTNNNKSTIIEDISETASKMVEIIVNSDYVVAMTGAGMSVESGIPTFRGEGGLWTQYGEPSMDGFKRFKADPKGWWYKELNRQMDEYIIHLREALCRAQPHRGHMALSELQKIGVINHVITQNIDGLDLKAGLKNITEIHGNRSRLRCFVCGERRPIGQFVPVSPPNPCKNCGGVMKFDTVMFGEPIPKDVFSEARAQIKLADCVIAIGTSATVRPASGLLWIAKAEGASILEVNPFETNLTNICDISLRMTAGEAMKLMLSTTKAYLES